MSERPKCATCRHWRPEAVLPPPEGCEPIVPSEGECRIRAPQFRDGYTRAVWPCTGATESCSEHEGKQFAVTFEPLPGDA